MNKILLTIILYFSQTFAFQGVPDFEYPFDESFKSLRMGNNFDVSSCSVAASRREDIKTYASVVRQIFEATQPGGAFEGKTYSDLGIFVDKFGSRLSGSEALERSIDFMVKEMEKSGLTNTHTEDAPVPKWERIKETAELILPRKQTLAVKAAGLSVSTPKDGITADVIAVNSEESFKKERENMQGKIVVFTNSSSRYRISMAAQHGAVACLTKSRTPMSLNTPHIGVQFYDPRLPKIPIGSLSPEDADLISRISERGEQLRMFLLLETSSNGTTKSRNVIGDLIGRGVPEELVVLSGHIDSWDVGQGAVDDGVGILLALEVINLFKHLQLVPRRTVRTVFWTGEEMGLYGARAWLAQHKSELKKYVAALESDYGCFKAMGYIFTGKPSVGCVLNEIRSLMLPPANLTLLTRARFMPTDVAYMAATGVPSVVLNGNDGKYFWYHHTTADVLTAMQSKELDTCLAVWATTAFILADMKENLELGN